MRFKELSTYEQCWNEFEMLRFKFDLLHVRYIIGHSIDDACVFELVCN